MKKYKISKTLFAIALIFGLFYAANSQSYTNTSVPRLMNIYDININSLMGEEINLNDLKGKKILFVNVASECGFTPQYEGLQKLHDSYGDKITIIGVPCNQFGSQEPGNAEEIKGFCEKNYGVTFMITEKIEVKGENQHPLYQWLTKKELNAVNSSSVKWNFQKYLIDEDGKYIDVFYSTTKPMSGKILKHLEQ